MNKTLLVLAASTYQLPVIKTAKQLGWRVITTDNSPSNPGHQLADLSLLVDTTDQEGVLKIAQRECVDGIISPGTDVAVTTAAYVAEVLNLPGPTLHAAQILTDKKAFRNFMKEAGLPTPRTGQFSTLEAPQPEQLPEATWIIKPNRASGSKGVYILEQTGELNSRWQAAVALSTDGQAIFEEYLLGTQHTCEGVLREGSIQFSLITDRDTAAPPYTATTGHRVPTLLRVTVQNKIQAVIETVFRKLGVTDTPFDCDFIAQDNSVTIIEITPRLGGNSLSNLIQASHNFNLVEYAVQQACGVSPTLPLPQPPNPSAILILGVECRGELYFDTASFHALRREKWVKSLMLDYEIGDPVEPFINGRHRVGEALIVGDDRQDVDKKISLLRATLSLTAR